MKMQILQLRIKKENSNRGRENFHNGMAFEFKLLRSYKRRSDVLWVIRSAGSHSIVDIVVQFKNGRQYWLSVKKNGIYLTKELGDLRALKDKKPNNVIIKLAYYISPKKYTIRTF